MIDKKVIRLKKKKVLTVFIASPSDGPHPESIQNTCADTWVKHELSIALKKLGYTILEDRPDQRPPDVLIHFFGVSTIFGKSVKQFSSSIFKIVWIYSHPEKVNSSNLHDYDRIYCLSTSYPEKLKKMGYPNAQVMLGATSKRPLKVLNKYDIVFVGNSRGSSGRTIVKDLKSLGKLPYRIGIWGRGWKGRIPDSWYGGYYWPYSELSNLYASSKICIQDHRIEMAREGFVSIKIFDILASGSLAISDSNAGMRKVFKGAVPEYKSVQHLGQLLNYYINNSQERARLIKLGQKTAFACPWEKRAALFMGEFRE